MAVMHDLEESRGEDSAELLDLKDHVTQDMDRVTKRDDLEKEPFNDSELAHPGRVPLENGYYFDYSHTQTLG